MRDRWLIGIGVVWVVVYAAWATFVVLTDRPLDYYVYVIAAEVLARGENIYLAPAQTYHAAAADLGITNYTRPYQYPPLTALLVWPLTLLPLRVGAFVWVSGSGLAVLGTAMLFAADAPANWQRRLMLLVLPGFVPVITTMHAGQVNAFVLLAAVLALAAWRQQRPVVGGAWLALSFWLKPLVIALVGLLLWRGHWRALGGFVAGSLLITLAGVLAFGPEPTLTQRSGAEVSAALSGQPMPFPPVQNLRGLLSRWLTPHPHGAALLDMSQHFAPVYPALLLVGGIILLVLFWPPGRRGRPLDIEAALLIVSTLLLAPFTWFHHLTLLFIGFAVLITRWSDWRRHRWELAALGAAYVSLAVHGLLWKLLDGSTLLLDGGTWASLLLWVLLVRQLFYERTAALYPAVGDGEETDASHDHTSKYSQKEP